MLSVARLVPEKGLDVLVEAAAAAAVPALLLVVAGDGPERAALERLAAARGVRLRVLGDVAWDDLPGVYAAADVFALVSQERAVGRRRQRGRRGGAAARALRSRRGGTGSARGRRERRARAGGRRGRDRRGAPPARRTTPRCGRRMGRRSRASMRDRGYEPSVDAFVATVLEAVAR